MAQDSRTHRLPVAGVAALAALTIANPSFGQPQTFTHPFTAPVDGYSYTLTMTGGNPFKKNPEATTLKATMIPVALEVWNNELEAILGFTPAVFDALGTGGCDKDGTTATLRFFNSPLVVKSDLQFMGVDVGNVQFTTGFKRAEFWNKPGGQVVDDTIVWTEGLPVSISAYIDNGDVVIVSGPSCSRAVTSADFLNNWFESYLTTNPYPDSDFVFFLVDNVVQSHSPKADPTNCCEKGANNHKPTGVGWGWANYDSYGDKGQIDGSAIDIHAPSHEIAEWANSPVYNPTPAWGNIGESANSCDDTKFQVGDPLPHATPVPIKLNGFTYHVAELAYWGWFYDAINSMPDVGLGGQFSSNGTFSGPHGPCPLGGTILPR